MPPATRPTTTRAGWLALASGLVFLLAVTYLFTVLTGAGLTLAMFDDAAALLPWIDTHLHAYQGLYLLYGLSQLLLLPVPALLGRATRSPAAAVVGTGAALLALTSSAVSYGLAGPAAAAFTAAGDDAGRWAALVTHAVVADVAKDVRLFSELLLGVWLAAAGWTLARGEGRRGGWVPAVVGAWTVLVAGWKLIDPLMPLEDWLAFVVAAAQIALGVTLLRGGRPGPAASQATSIASSSA